MELRSIWPAGTSGPTTLAEDKSEAQGPVQILTVGQSDHAKDAGETAAGGGTRPSGQDLRATMQRKGEPHGGPAGTKAQSQVLSYTLLQENKYPYVWSSSSLDVTEGHYWSQMRSFRPGLPIRPS